MLAALALRSAALRAMMAVSAGAECTESPPRTQPPSQRDCGVYSSSQLNGDTSATTPPGTSRRGSAFRNASGSGSLRRSGT